MKFIRFAERERCFCKTLGSQSALLMQRDSRIKSPRSLDVSNGLNLIKLDNWLFGNLIIQFGRDFFFHSRICANLCRISANPLDWIQRVSVSIRWIDEFRQFELNEVSRCAGRWSSRCLAGMSPMPHRSVSQKCLASKSHGSTNWFSTSTCTTYKPL